MYQQLLIGWIELRRQNALRFGLWQERMAIRNLDSERKFPLPIVRVA
ncbi:MAG: hypothetical protein V7731_24155 [Amphritea sp.]